MENVSYDMEKATQVLRRRLNPRWIEKRQQGGQNVNFIGSHIVIHLLNEAFNYQWSFEVVREEYFSAKNDSKAIKVLGRLTVPGLCVKEQYGTAVINKGNVDSASKIAATDALKKCASLLGIGLELSKNANVHDFYDSPKTPEPARQPQAQTLTWDSVKPELAKLNQLKAKLNITTDEQMNRYVQQFFNRAEANKSHITPNNVVAFNQFLEKQVA